MSQCAAVVLELPNGAQLEIDVRADGEARYFLNYTSQKDNSKFQRWTALLSEYDFTFEWVPGSTCSSTSPSISSGSC